MRTTGWVVGAVIQAVVSLTGLGAVQATEHPPEGLIAFTSNREEGRLKLYVMDVGVGTTTVRRLSSVEPELGRWSWSPHGDQIAYPIPIFISTPTPVSYRALYIRGVTRDTRRSLTGRRYLEMGRPAWSPDGTWIAFYGVENPPQDLNPPFLYIVAVDESETRTCLQKEQEFLRPQISYDSISWSPDGDQLALSVSKRDPKTGSRASAIYLMNADCSGVRELTPKGIQNDQAVWSPDGTRIAFTRLDESDRVRRLYVMNPDGSEQTLYGKDVRADPFSPPNWSPDSARIAFGVLSPRMQVSEGEIHVIDADGGNLTQLTTTGGRVMTNSISWSPDSTHLTFSATFEGLAEVYTIEASPGAQPINQTRHPAADDSGPQWAPAPPKGQ